MVGGSKQLKIPPGGGFGRVCAPPPIVKNLHLLEGGLGNLETPLATPLEPIPRRRSGGRDSHGGTAPQVLDLPRILYDSESSFFSFQNHIKHAYSR